MRASQFARLGIRTLMGNFVPPPPTGLTISRAGVSVGAGRSAAAVLGAPGIVQRTGIAVGTGRAAAAPIISEQWQIEPLVFELDAGETVNLRTTLPSGFATDGLFELAPTSNPLPSGITLSEDGILADTGAPLDSVSGVSFTYAEKYGLPELILIPAQAGTFPYTATVYPLEGAVPSGQELYSPDDSTLRSSVLSRWPDNSAAVMVVAGSYVFPDTASRTLRLRAGIVSNVPLTTAAVTAAMGTGITVNFSGTPQTLSDFTTPDWVWWANSQVICARYRLSCGLGVMEAVIDIHAFAGGKAWVEVVVENGKFNCNLSDGIGPVAQSYTDATLAVNGTTFRTVSARQRGESLRSPSFYGTGGYSYGPKIMPVGTEWVVSNVLATPPVTPPAVGTKYLVSTSPTGAWVGYASNLAEWDGAQYLFTAPVTGQVMTRPVASFYYNPFIWDGTGWINGWGGGHEPFRAFYVAANVNGATITDATSAFGPFGVEVTHDTAHMQSHPMFFRPMEPSSENMSTKYGGPWDTYAPWEVGRQRLPGMGQGGGGEQIGLFTMSQSDYLITGSKYARRALLATDLGGLSLNSNWRHDGTGGGAGRMPTRAQMSSSPTMSKRTAESGASTPTWPSILSEPKWDGQGSAHCPAQSLVAFMCRPSPCFIELAQKQTTRHATFFKNVPSMAHWYDQQRSRAWGLRDHAGTIWLTPDADYDGTNRKAEMRTGLAGNIAVLNQFKKRTWNTLGVIFSNGVTLDFEELGLSDRAVGAEESFSDFMNSFTVTAWLMIDRIKVLRGTDATGWRSIVEWHCTWPIRRINDTPAGYGDWRVSAYYPLTGTVQADKSVDMGPGNFSERFRRSVMYGADPADLLPEVGPWLVDPRIYNPATNTFSWQGGDWDELSPNWTRIAEAVPPSSAVSFSVYDGQFWAAFSDAVQAGLPGADAAWTRVMNGIDEFATWRQGFGVYPIYNRWPRNK